MSSMLLLLCACWIALAAACSSKPYALEDVRLHFERFIDQYNKHYSSENEKQARFEIFKDNLESVNYMNERSDHAVFGITKFMDLTQEEFLRSYTGLRTSINDDEFRRRYNDGCDLLTDSDVPDANAPTSFDWRQHNVVTRVKDQTNNCGSCYAFSATGNIEGQYAKKYKKLIEFSEQQIVDCSDMNCDGGSVYLSFRELIKMGGAMSKVDYPYIAQDSYCKFDKNKVKVQLSNCYRYNLTSQDKVKQLLYKNGPISIGVTSHRFQTYERGIMSDDFCGNYSVDHAVLLVGYGSENGKDYWIVKNSWGVGFGEDGYFRVHRSEGASSCKMLNDKMATSIIL